MARFNGAPVEQQPNLPPRFKGAPITEPVGPQQQGPAMPPPDELRRARLREIARAATQQQGGGAGSIFKDAYTLGLQKPLAGVASGIGSMVSGGGFGEGYTEGTKGYQEALDQAQAESGAAGTAAGIAGSLTTGGPARSIVATTVPSLARSVGNTALLSGVEGAARGSESLEEAVTGAGTGAAVGGATAGLVHGATQIPGFRARREAARTATRGPAPDELRTQARQIYGQLDQSGTAFSQQQALDLGNQIGPALRAENIRVQDMPVAEDLISHQGPMTLEELQRFRTRASDLARSSDDRERRMAGVLLRSIDDFVGNNAPAQTSLPPDQVAPLWAQARQHWRTAALADDLGFAVNKAERRAASTASGGNVENAIRQNIRGVRDRATKPGAYNPYTPETIAEMDRIIEGTRGQNALRAVGNTLGGSGPIGNLAPFAGAGAASAFGLLDPSGATQLGLAAWGAGKGARLASRNMTENAADRLIGQVARGGAPVLTPAQQAIMQGPPTRQRLALMQALGLATRGAGLEATRAISE